MLRKTLTLIALFSVLAGAGRCYAGGLQNQPTGGPNDEAKLLEMLREAKAKNRRLTIKLTNGQVFVGKVTRVSIKDFELVPAPRSGYKGSVAVQYGNVSSLKQQSAAAKLFDDIGDKTLTVLKYTGLVSLVLAAAPLVIPLLLLAAILGEPLDC